MYHKTTAATSEDEGEEVEICGSVAPQRTRGPILIQPVTQTALAAKMAEAEAALAEAHCIQAAAKARGRALLMANLLAVALQAAVWGVVLWRDAQARRSCVRDTASRFSRLRS